MFNVWARGKIELISWTEKIINICFMRAGPQKPNYKGNTFNSDWS